MTPGKRIRQARKEMKLTQVELSGMLLDKYAIEVDDSMISLYEADRNLPTLKTLESLAEIFEVSLDWLCCRSEIRNPDKQLAALNYPADVIDLADKLNGVSNGLRRFIVGYAGELLGKCAPLQNRQMAHVKEMLESNGLTDEWEAEHHINVSG